MAVIEFWHNPRCSKSRQALALVENQPGLRLRLYLQDPPSEGELRALHAKLGGPVRAMMRVKETLYKTLDLAQASDDALFAAMAAHPVLIERPVAQTATAARIGRPPETVVQILA
jgi:arsenate reductase